MPPHTRSRRRSKRSSTSQTSNGPSSPQPSAVRLQKVLADAGFGSRRACEELITAGRVSIDNEVVTLLGTKVDLQRQSLQVDGESVLHQARTYHLVNKPRGVVSTHLDPARRPRVIDLVPGQQRMFTVGRLDMASEGLILVTNDGNLANQLAHPRYGVEKTYEVEVAGNPDRATLDRLRRGVHLAEAFVKLASLKVRRRRKSTTVLEFVLNEGRNREIRRMMARMGHKVLRLRRIALGPLKLGDLQPGSSRPLKSGEIRTLKRLTTANSSNRQKGHSASSLDDGKPKGRPTQQGHRSRQGPTTRSNRHTHRK